jgi:hypothetical protein
MMNPEQLNVAKDISYRLSQCIQRNDYFEAWKIHAELERHFKNCGYPDEVDIS